MSELKVDIFLKLEVSIILWATKHIKFSSLSEHFDQDHGV